MNEVVPENYPVVVGVDGSESALAAVRWGARDAAHRHTSLRLVHALTLPGRYDDAWSPSVELREQLGKRASEMLAAAKDVATGVAGIAVEAVIEDGDPAPVLNQESRRARLVVLGGSGHGGFLGGHAIGSTAIKVASHAHSPVVVVRGEDADRRPEHDPIVVGIDGSPLSESALWHAFEEASLRGAPLVAMHTWYDADAAEMLTPERFAVEWGTVQEAAERLLAERLAGWGEKYPDVTVERQVTRGRPHQKLLELSKRAQLVVVGSRGRGGFTGLLLGSHSQALIHAADCPVMVVRPAADRT